VVIFMKLFCLLSVAESPGEQSA